MGFRDRLIDECQVQMIRSVFPPFTCARKWGETVKRMIEIGATSQAGAVASSQDCSV